MNNRIINPNHIITEDDRPKILIIGHGRHGKDTVAEILRDEFGMSFSSSSLKAAEIFLFDEMKHTHGYTSLEECYEDRHNHRDEWYEKIKKFNKDDPARLAKIITKDHDCYVGMRDETEIKSCIDQGIFDFIIWVDASERLPLEPSSSFNIDKSLADVIMDNNYSKELLFQKVRRLGQVLFRFV